MTISKLHQAALDYAARGWPVFPTRPDDPTVEPKRLKAPAFEGSFHDATTDLAKINEWWSINPDFNVASSPHATGCGVVDLDRPEASAAIELEHGELPATLTARSWSGRGYHMWYRGHFPSKAHNIAPNVDTRGEGGYVLLPPSRIHGKEYTWISDDPIAEMPQFLSDLAGRSKKGPEIELEIEKHELDLPWAIERGRQECRKRPRGDDPRAGDAMAYQLACELWGFGLSGDKIYELMQEEWNQHLTMPGEKGGPLSEDHLRQKIINAHEFKQNKEGQWAIAPAEETYAHFLGMIVDKPPSKFRPLSEAETEGLPPPTWLIKDVIPSQSTVVLYAPSKAWKTFLALDLALTIAAGHDKWGSVEQGPVVYIAAEGSTGLAKSRRPAWKLLHGIDRPVPFFVIPTMPWVNKSEDVIDMIETVIATCGKPKLLVVDTLARSMAGLDENSAKDSGLAIEALETMKRSLGCSVLVLHHTGKETGKGLRGSSALMAGFDSGLEMKTDKDSMTTQLWARWHKDAEAPEHPWNLKAERIGDSFAFRFAGEEDLPQEDRFNPADFGRILRGMNVTKAADAVPVPVIATEAAKVMQREERKLERLIKALASAGKLKAYEAERGLYWCPLEDDPLGEVLQ